MMGLGLLVPILVIVALAYAWGRLPPNQERNLRQPQMTYLTRWRMLGATRLLKHEVRIEAIAEQLGYESEAAFRKAFKREIGIPSAQLRKLG
jgi:AraC-like DNA-binding protein